MNPTLRKYVGIALVFAIAILGATFGAVGATEAQDTGCEGGGSRCVIEHPDGDVDIWYNKRNRAAVLEVN